MKKTISACFCSSFLLPPSSFLLSSVCILPPLFYILFFHGLDRRDLWNSHEARAGMNAQTMLTEEDWLLARLHDGQWDLQKPPLYYWLVAGIARWRGGTVDAWAVRLPSALSALICVLGLGLLGWALARPKAGILAALLLATAIHFTWLARVGRIDMPLTCAIAVALGSIYLASRDGMSTLPTLLLQLLAYLAVACAVLLKGPIGFVLPVAVVGMYLLLERQLPPPWRIREWGALLHRLGVWWGLPLVLGLTLPWFFLANQKTGGEFFQVFFWHHNVQRGLGGSRLRGHPWWFYIPQLLLDFLPWSLLLFPAGWYFFSQKRWRLDPEARFGLIWLATVLVLLSCCRYKRADYLVPAYPGAALFLGCIVSRWCRASTWGLLGVLLAVAALGWWVRVEYLLPPREPAREHRAFARAIRDHAPSPQEILFFQTESHPLAFHLGWPIRILVDWDDLARWAAQPGPRHVVMPVAVAHSRPDVLASSRLEEVIRNSDLLQGEHEKPLVLLQVRPQTAGGLNDEGIPYAEEQPRHHTSN